MKDKPKDSHNEGLLYGAIAQAIIALLALLSIVCS